MGQLLACMINRPEHLQAAVRYETESARATPLAKDGWGIGFYHAGEVLHKKRPKADAATGWAGMFEGVRSDVAIAHVRDATVGAPRANNTHPFRMRQWLFAHGGSIGGFAAIRDRLVTGLPDFLQRNLRGDTDSEHLFHVLLSFLHDSGQIDVPEAAEQAVGAAIRSTVTLVDQLSREVGAPVGDLNLALTNGRDLYLLRRGGPYYLTERSSLMVEPGPTDGPDNAAPSDTRYVLALAQELPEKPMGYRELGDNTVVHVSRDLAVTEQQL
ncbi:MAG: class II glutamine amidotransferase [Myxococcales bacterium]|nr:class II glutamine amidotransferase [Myxococcales bacterium]MDD9966032.1 class II glutamine amidotransferase [Myxococcales bacterium]